MSDKVEEAPELDDEDDAILDRIWDDHGKPTAEHFSVVSLPVHHTTQEDAFALPGPTGRRVSEILGQALSDGQRILAQIAGQAVARKVAARSAGPRLFNDAELKRLAGVIEASIVAADVIGRVRVARYAEQIEQRRTVNFAADPLDVFVGHAPLQSHALDYFTSLVSRLGVNPEIYGDEMLRRAFTLAVATEQTMVEKVHKALADHLGHDWTAPARASHRSQVSGARVVQAVLDDVGVTPKNPQYAEMVFRTNTLDAYHTGFSQQLAQPAMKEKFPVWQYLGIEDGREGDDHRPKFGRYYPSSVTFAEVRGKRPFNCRCSAAPIHYTEWESLLADGVKAETSW